MEQQARALPLTKGMVLDIQRFSIHDGPGIRTTVFLKGCPLGCRWCDNPESINPWPELGFIKERCNLCAKCLPACPEGAISLRHDGMLQIDRKRCTNCGDCIPVCLPQALILYGREMTAAQVLEEVRRDELFYGNSGGVTLSGGEPLAQPLFVQALFELCRQAGIHRALETSGFATKPVWAEILPLADYVLYDLKHLDSEAHQEFTGMPNSLILENAKMVAASGVPLLFRTPLIPPLNGTMDNIAATARFLRALQGGDAAIELMPYHRLGLAKYNALGKPHPMQALEPPEPARVEAARRAYEDWGLRCTVSQ